MDSSDSNAKYPCLRWDIFCQVIDNYGDVGVCLRLARGLHERCQTVRLWLSETTIIEWMLPKEEFEFEVRGYDQIEEFLPMLPSSDVWIESFGCEIPPAWVSHWAKCQAWPDKWFNLEYLSGESYVERCHGLLSPILAGEAKGQGKIFFYPGFTPKTGGLLRPNATLSKEQRAALRKMELSSLDVIDEDCFLVLLFCYHLDGFMPFLEQLIKKQEKITILVAQGKTQQAWEKLKPDLPKGINVVQLPWLHQKAFDQLLSITDLNLVRGEDSMVQALWTGVPLLWQIYPQSDGTHGVKLEAWLSVLGVQGNYGQWQRAWNGLLVDAMPSTIDLGEWQKNALTARALLAQQIDLVTQLLRLTKE